MHCLQVSGASRRLFYFNHRGGTIVLSLFLSVNKHKNPITANNGKKENICRILPILLAVFLITKTFQKIDVI